MSEVNLNGVLERIIFSNEETHYCVGEVSQEKGTKVILSQKKEKKRKK